MKTIEYKKGPLGYAVIVDGKGIGAIRYAGAGHKSYLIGVTGMNADLNSKNILHVNLGNAKKAVEDFIHSGESLAPRHSTSPIERLFKRK